MSYKAKEPHLLYEVPDPTVVKMAPHYYGQEAFLQIYGA